MIASVATLVLTIGALFLLWMIAAKDFQTQRIANTDVIALLVVALGLRGIELAQHADYYSVLLALAMALAIFAATIGFWLMGKLGAGDVKLLSVVPLLVGSSSIMAFLITFLLASLLTYGIMKYPLALPWNWYTVYVDAMRSTNRVPFGVPISIAAAIGLLFALTASLQGI